MKLAAVFLVIVSALTSFSAYAQTSDQRPPTAHPARNSSRREPPIMTPVWANEIRYACLFVQVKSLDEVAEENAKAGHSEMKDVWRSKIATDAGLTADQMDEIRIAADKSFAIDDDYGPRIAAAAKQWRHEHPGQEIDSNAKPGDVGILDRQYHDAQSEVIAELDNHLGRKAFSTLDVYVSSRCGTVEHRMAEYRMHQEEMTK